MFSNGVLIFIISVFFFSLTAGALGESSGSDPNDLFFVCRRAKNVRWLRAYKLDSGKCKTIYSKEGYLQVISAATYFASCEGVLLSVKKNLEEGNFRCVQMPKASVIELESQ